MRYPVILEPQAKGGYSVMIPDLPGCFSQGDTFEEAVTHAKEAIELHLFGLREDGLPLPSPRTVEAIRDKKHPEFQYAFVEIDPSQLAKGVRRVRARRIQVTMPPHLLAEIDEERAGLGMARSKWLQEAARFSLMKRGEPTTGYRVRERAAYPIEGIHTYGKKGSRTSAVKGSRASRAKATRKGTRGRK